MRIIGLFDGAGPMYHRVFVPLILMPKHDVLLTTKITEEQISKCDVLYINRLAPANYPSEVFKWREQYGFKIVVDLDDHWNIGQSHILTDFYKEHQVSTFIEHNIIQADAVSVTHERLAEEVMKLNDNVYCLPNAIADYNQFHTQRDSFDKVRLFWAGGITHEKDLNLLQMPLTRVASDPHLKNQILMIMGGFQQGNPHWQNMVRSFTANGKLTAVTLPGRKVTEYYKLYQNADICLIPLAKSTFNTHKSNLKILEAAHLGIPVIVSAVHPYLGFPDHMVNYVYKQSDWYKHIKLLTNDKGFREAQGQMLKEYCEDVYNFERINTARKEMLEQWT